MTQTTSKKKFFNRLGNKRIRQALNSSETPPTRLGSRAACYRWGAGISKKCIDAKDSSWDDEYDFWYDYWEWERNYDLYYAENDPSEWTKYARCPKDSAAVA